MDKFQITNNKSQTMVKSQITHKPYDLEERTLEFAKTVIELCQKLPITVVNKELIRQLVRSATSVGANYREANEALGNKDFKHRMRITRKEAKETTYWLELINNANHDFYISLKTISQESKELRNIFTSIIEKS